MTKDLVVLYSSFSDFQDVLPITHHFYRKHCSALPFEVFWGSNGHGIQCFETIAPDWHLLQGSDEDLGWSGNLKSYLEQIKSEYVLLILDDFIFLKPPCLKEILEGFFLMKEEGAVYLRLRDRPGPDKPLSGGFGVIPYYSDHRASLQPAIWKKEFLLELCEYNFNQWEFEIKAGVVKLAIDQQFLGSISDLMNARHCITKGMWIPHMLKLIEQEGLEISDRAVMSPKQKSAIGMTKNAEKSRLINRIHPKSSSMREKF